MGLADTYSQPEAPDPVLPAEVGRALRSVHCLDVAALRDTGLFPAEDDATGLRRRLALGFADIVDAMTECPSRWQLLCEPQEIAAAAVAALPTALAAQVVALHSNAGPVHVFVNTRGVFTVLIDFGDSYVSHPALDLRAWPDPVDRIALRTAYLDGENPDPEFEAVWTVAMMYADLSAILVRPELAERASDDLDLRLASL